ncbi:Bypass of stop codon protein 6 OS=Saccharomyces cerevisiae (strain ATCC 204508 / S288c) GN=BSC6 PE=1 SV=1 [Rhizoctonia solani AG-1 IB]|uniref:Bypass of stop codon protein 6 n=1 Tax=Thanatephorus cucumeris (strain AG1-IB / isolate 7/3/14) TaxID=1108050 RepID=A0A0B7FE47_THACB|nr:Bypass of stop codon protein 6 OS=Saccharomyces cerevisiae (strain ATCC 204508 / S288c) GN=BSC6 PE=1 SV=1 [Rhizoctonia solani AG-1 IB]
MSQTTTSVIELDVLPRLEHGTVFDHPQRIHAETPDVLTSNFSGEYFSGNGDNAGLDHTGVMGSAHTLANPVQPSQNFMLRIGSTVVEEKVLYLAGACMGIFAAGLNFTATGANLPSFQSYYQLSYQTVSLVFLASFGGYLVSCVLNSILQSVIGARNVLLMAGALYGGGALLISFAPPFPAVVVGLTLMGFGRGFYEACLTSVVSHFEDNRFMNIVYAFSGLGALVSPFVIGALTKSDTPWKLYYWFPFSLAMLSAACHYFIFKGYVAPLDHEEAPEHKNVGTRFKLAMRMPVTWIGIVLITFSYAIVDVLSNWLTSYLIDVKGSAPDTSRYQLSVFWAGLTIGRIFFSLPFVHVRERAGNNLLLALMGGAIGLLWGLNNTGSNWISIAVAGFFLGPNTPGILSIVSARVPPSLKEIIVSFTIGSALVGGTLGSLIFGITVGKVSPGLHLLPPVIIVLASLSALIFWAMPARRKVD